jgi:hypothetical protein
VLPKVLPFTCSLFDARLIDSIIMDRAPVALMKWAPKAKDCPIKSSIRDISCVHELVMTPDSEVACGLDSILEVSAFQRSSGLGCQEMRTTDVGS